MHQYLFYKPLTMLFSVVHVIPMQLIYWLHFIWRKRIAILNVANKNIWIHSALEKLFFMTFVGLLLHVCISMHLLLESTSVLLPMHGQSWRLLVSLKRINVLLTISFIISCLLGYLAINKSVTEKELVPAYAYWSTGSTPSEIVSFSATDIKDE